MEELLPRQSETDTALLSAEQQVEAERLQHGVAALDLFEQEVAAEDRRANFLQATAAGTDTRAEILRGPSYNGDTTKLTRAIVTVRRGYALQGLRRSAMLEHASFLGIPATIAGQEVITENPDGQRQLAIEHGDWRKKFASRSRSQDRTAYREFLLSRIQAIDPSQSFEKAADAVTEPLGEGLSVSLEERAVLLTRAINAMAWRSMLSGFAVATSDERYNEPIYERYEDVTPAVDRLAQGRRDRMFNQAKRDFWAASGYPDIREREIMSEFLLGRRSQKMWQEFAGQFEHSTQQTQRVKVRKQLKKFIPNTRLDEVSIKDV